MFILTWGNDLWVETTNWLQYVHPLFGDLIWQWNVGPTLSKIVVTLSHRLKPSVCVHFMEIYLLKGSFGIPLTNFESYLRNMEIPETKRRSFYVPLTKFWSNFSIQPASHLHARMQLNHFCGVFQVWFGSYWVEGCLPTYWWPCLRLGGLWKMYDLSLLLFRGIADMVKLDVELSSICTELHLASEKNSFPA